MPGQAAAARPSRAPTHNHQCPLITPPAPAPPPSPRHPPPPLTPPLTSTHNQKQPPRLPFQFLALRQDDSTRYFVVVGGGSRSRASAEVIRPNHLNRPTWD